MIRRALAALALIPVLAAAAADPVAARLAPLLADDDLAGAVFALVDGDRVELGALGHAHAPSATPMRVESRVQAGSIAKTLISLAVLRLATQGRVALDAPVAALLPGLALDNPWQASHPLRLRHLLDHTSGLDDLRLWHLLNRQHAARMPLRAAHDRLPAMLRVRTPPGTRMSYSNFGYLLAGRVIEAVTGEAYEDWGRRELLEPLGLRDSHLDFRTQVGPDADPRLAWGHLEGGRPQAALATAVRPAAQFTTTAADMARLLQFLMGDGRVAGRPFIDTALLRSMGRPVGTDAAQAGLAAGYALGLATRDRHGAVGLCHEGSIVGFRAMLCLYPQARRGYFIGINTDSESGRHVRLYEVLTGALDVATPLPAAEPRADAAAADWNGRYVRAPSRLESFAALDLLFDTRVWAVEAGQVQWQRSGAAATLLPAGPGLFRLEDRQQASHVRLRGTDGVPMVADGFGSFRRLPTGVWQAAWASMLLGAAGLAWWLLAPVWRRWRHGSRLARPGWLAVLALPAAAGLLALQGWPSLGEFTPGSAAVWLATAALAPAMGWQALQAWRARPARAAWLDLAAALAVVQATLLLAAGGLVPLALWR